MNRIVLLVTFLACMSPIAMTSAEPLQSIYAPTPGTPKPNGTYGIEALLSMPKASYKAGEPITVTFALKNLRNSAQFLKCLRAPLGNGLIITDGAGHRVPSTGLKDIGKPMAGGRTHYEVQPGAVLNCATDVSIVYWGYRLEPGTYTARATWAETDLPYHDPILSNAVNFLVSQLAPATTTTPHGFQRSIRRVTE
jgi:hypothetical protein